MRDKTLQFLRRTLVGKIRCRRLPRVNTPKKEYCKQKYKWPVVLIYKIERWPVVIWPSYPDKKQTINGFKVHYMDNSKFKSIRFDRAKWILKNFPKYIKE